MLFLVNPWLTKKNGGNPVLIFTNTYSDKELGRSSMRLVSYDTGTGKKTVIKDQIDDTGFQDLCAYGDVIFYTCNEGKYGYNIYRVDIDGENYMKMDNPRRRLNYEYGIYNNRIYYVDGNTGGLYSNSLDFDDEQYHFKVAPYANIHVYDGYIYYSQTAEKVE